MSLKCSHYLSGLRIGYCLITFLIVIFAANAQAMRGPFQLSGTRLNHLCLIIVANAGRQVNVCIVTPSQAAGVRQTSYRCSQIIHGLRNPHLLPSLNTNPRGLVEQGHNYQFWTSSVNLQGSTSTTVHQSESNGAMAPYHQPAAAPALELINNPQRLIQTQAPRSLLSEFFGSATAVAMVQPGQALANYQVMSPADPTDLSEPLQFAGVVPNPQNSNQQQLVFQPPYSQEPLTDSLCTGGLDPRTGMPRCITNPSFPRNRFISFYEHGSFTGMLIPSAINENSYMFVHTLQSFFNLMGKSLRSCWAEYTRDEDRDHHFDDQDDPDSACVR